MAVREWEKLGLGLKNLGEVPLVFDNPMDSEFIVRVAPGYYQQSLSRRVPGWGRSEGSFFVKGGS